MNIKVKYQGDIVILYLEGKIDINAANLIETTGQLARDGYARMLCNFKSVDFIDNNGLSVLAITYKNVINRGSIMKFCSVPRNICDLFKMVRLDLVFDIYEDEAKALVAFETSSRVDKMYLRRRFKRLDFFHPVKFFAGDGDKEKNFTGKILNISGAGVFIYTKHIYPVMTNLRIEIKLDDEKEYVVDGLVLWLADKDLQPHCCPGMGVQFVNISNQTQKEIIDFIEKNISFRPE